MQKTAHPAERAPEASGPDGHRTGFLWLGLAVIALVAAVAVAAVFWNIGAKEEELERSLEKRLELLAAGRAEVMAGWLEGVARQGDRVIHSDLFRLYAAEVALIEGNVSLLVAGGRAPAGEAAGLAAQLPMMQNLLLEFTRYAGFLSGRVVHPSGQAYIATDAGTSPLTPPQLALVRQAVADGRTHYAPLRPSPSGLVLDLCLPIFPPEAGGAEAPVAALLLSRAVSDKVNEILSGSPLAAGGERTRLLQRGDGILQEVVPWLPAQVEALKRGGDQPFPFGVRPPLRGEGKVYSLGAAVPGGVWWIVQEADYDAARQAFRTFRSTFSGLAALVVLVFGVTFGALWFRLVSAENRRTAERFRELARRIEEQRQLLDHVNNTIADGIGLKDLRGFYQYVNPAFARAVGHAPQEVVGLDDAALFGFDTARRLEHSDREVLAGGHPVSFSERLYLQSRRCDLLISKAPFRDGDGNNAGVVSVLRDVTEMVAAQERHERAVKQTVSALVKAIELTDPYLAGHSRRMEGLAREVARGLGAGEVVVATVETAANLSQVGKMYLDRGLIGKAGALSEEEQQEMERHVEHAANVLRGVEFGLPVFEAVCQMNEHLDGSGYPVGLRDDEIGLPARILAVTNSFCAMVEPRAYRAARPVEEALAILEGAPHLYDGGVVRVLGEVVHSAVGEKILAREGD